MHVLWLIGLQVNLTPKVKAFADGGRQNYLNAGHITWPGGNETQKNIQEREREGAREGERERVMIYMVWPGGNETRKEERKEEEKTMWYIIGMATSRSTHA